MFLLSGLVFGVPAELGYADLPATVEEGRLLYSESGCREEKRIAVI